MDIDSELGDTITLASSTARATSQPRRSLAAAASDLMRLGNWQLPREFKPRLRLVREQLESARAALARAMATREGRDATVWDA